MAYDFEDELNKAMPNLTSPVDNWRRKGRPRLVDKIRLPSTLVGEVPLRDGKYGLSVVEFLEYSRLKEGRGRVVKLEVIPWGKNDYEDC